MVHEIFHFRPGRDGQDLILSNNHRVLGKLSRYLMNFQLDAIRFLYKNFESNSACIFNDESGLGKTAAVVAFLSAILPADNAKRCLVIVKDDDGMTNWRFHFDILTKLRVKVLLDDKGIDNDNNVFLVDWNTLRNSSNLTKSVFNCVILDDRGDLTAARTCLNFLLRHFENRISLIVASSDVTLEIKQLHGILRLCGRLDEKYRKIKNFEEKFSLTKPEGKLAKDRAVLEAYFQRREKIINYCRDFRLRRYRHQFEDILPLVKVSVHEKNITEWREKHLTRSLSSSSGSVKLLSSSSEKNTEELFQTYFDSKNEKLLNEEVEKITENGSHLDTTAIGKITHDTEDMSPLLFESDSEELPVPAKFDVKNVQATIEIIRPKVLKIAEMVVHPPENTIKSPENQQSSPDPANQKEEKKRYRRNYNAKQTQRHLRSADRKTRRSKSCPSRDAIIEVFRMVEEDEDRKKRKKRRKRHSAPVKIETKAAEVLNVSSDSEHEIEAAEKLEYHPDPQTQTHNVIVARNNSTGSNYNFSIDLIGKMLPPETSEVQIYSPTEHIVVLSSSNESCEDFAPRPRTSKAKRNIFSGKISPSPDIFENYDEYDFFCSQKRATGLSGVKMMQHKRIAPSCLQKLEDDFCSRNKSNSGGDGISLKNRGIADILTNMVQIHSTNLGRSNLQSDNKITKYLSSQSIDSLQPNPPDTTTKEADCYPKTPNRRTSSVSQKGVSPSVARKSPKSQRQTPITPNGLTKWLIKKIPDSASQGKSNATKPTKRKRLDLCFKD